MKKSFIIILLISVSIISVFGQIAKDGDKYKETVYDNSYDHTKWGIEPQDKIFKFRAFTTSFDGEDDNNGDGNSDKWGIPEWVSFEVHKKTSKVSVNRPNTWMSEESLYDPTVAVAPKDETYHVAEVTKQDKPYSLTYNLSRGHMCPKNIANRLGADADYNTHTVLNACPQYQWFNNGIWKDLERLTENYADEYETVWVICGPVFNNKQPQLWLGEKDKNEKLVAVPDAFYKILIRLTEDTELPIVMAFIYPHAILQSDNMKKSNGYPHGKYLVSVNEIERLTELEFFTSLSDSEQELIEKDAASEIWEDPGEYDLME